MLWRISVILHDLAGLSGSNSFARDVCGSRDRDRHVHYFGGHTGMYWPAADPIPSSPSQQKNRTTPGWTARQAPLTPDIRALTGSSPPPTFRISGPIWRRRADTSIHLGACRAVNAARCPFWLDILCALDRVRHYVVNSDIITPSLNQCYYSCSETIESLTPNIILQFPEVQFYYNKWLYRRKYIWATVIYKFYTVDTSNWAAIRCIHIILDLYFTII